MDKLKHTLSIQGLKVDDDLLKTAPLGKTREILLFLLQVSPEKQIPVFLKILLY